MSWLKIFNIYHKPAEVFRSDLYVPILSGAAREQTPEMRYIMDGDDTGDNISGKNRNYGELTCWYWVWKNYLPIHPELQYVGFGHYRRMMVLSGERGKEFVANELIPNILRYHALLPTLDIANYRKIFAHNNENVNVDFINSHDMLVGMKGRLNPSLKKQYLRWCPAVEWKILEDIIHSEYPRFATKFEQTVNRNLFYKGMQFVMKKEMFTSFMDWLFPILFEIENKGDWSLYSGYNSVRVPAYLAERLLTVWIEYQKETHAAVVAECPTFLREPRLEFSPVELAVGDSLHILFNALAELLPDEMLRKRLVDWCIAQRFKK